MTSNILSTDWLADEGWAACPPCTGDHTGGPGGGCGAPGGPGHGRLPSVDPRATMPRMNISAPFSIGGGKLSQIHKLNADGTTSPQVGSPPHRPTLFHSQEQLHPAAIY